MLGLVFSELIESRRPDSHRPLTRCHSVDGSEVGDNNFYQAVVSFYTEQPAARLDSMSSLPLSICYHHPAASLPHHPASTAPTIIR